MARFADEYGEASDFARVRQTAADLWIGRKVRSAEKSAADRMNSKIWKMLIGRSRRACTVGEQPRAGAAPERRRA